MLTHTHTQAQLRAHPKAQASAAATTLGLDATAANLAGIGWRHPHYAQLLEQLPPLGFLEVHSENFFADGGAALATLVQARGHYAISLHGVGLALGSAAGLDDWHLERLARLVERIDPVRVSDHACFARGQPVQGAAAHAAHAVHAADLLPLPFNTEALDVLCANVQRVQERLQRRIAVENLSAYITLAGSDRSEVEFLNALTQRTGCQLLVDVNNIYVNALNAQGDATQRDTAAAVQACRRWLAGIAPGSVAEIHLAGHCVLPDIVIDDHGSLVCDAVWQIYQYAVQHLGPVPALIEWDTDIPPLATLLAEAARADAIQANAIQAEAIQAARAVALPALVQAVHTGAADIAPATSAPASLAADPANRPAQLQSPAP
jgi:uncharacterized protein